MDAAVEAEWGQFEERLQERLPELAGPLLLEVEVAAEPDCGTAPYVQFLGGPGQLRAEVSGNDVLAEEYELADAQVVALREIGWQDPDDETPNHHCDVPVSMSAVLAGMAVRTLREVFGVLSPEFVEEGPGAPSPYFEGAPTNAEELKDMTRAALQEFLGEEVEEDDDGDFPVSWGSALVYVRVLDDEPTVRIFGAVVHGVQRRRQAALEVHLLNRDVRGIKFVLEEDTVFAESEVPGMPFSSRQFGIVLGNTVRRLDRLDGDLALRVGGHTAFEGSAA